MGTIFSTDLKTSLRKQNDLEFYIGFIERKIEQTWNNLIQTFINLGNIKYKLQAIIRPMFVQSIEIWFLLYFSPLKRIE